MTADEQVRQLFLSAQRLHQAGQMQGAETLYRQALALNPQHGNTLQMLGVLSQQLGRGEQAVSLLRQAIAVDPTNANYRVNLGVIFASQGNTPAAAQEFRAATELSPYFVEAHNNLAKCLRALGQYEEAYQAAARAVALKADHADALNEMGSSLQMLGRLDDAAAALRRALTAKPNFPEAMNNLGSVLQLKGHADLALPLLDQVLKLRPAFPEALVNRGNALHTLTRHREAVEAYRQALSLAPNNFQGWSNLAIALLELDDATGSLDACRRSIAINPNYANAHQNLGYALRKLSQLDESAEAFKRCSELEPSNGDALANYANCLRDVGLMEEAIPIYRKAMELTPASWPAESYIYSLYFRTGETPASILEAHRQWNARYVKPLVARPAFANDRNPDRRLRIGYISPDFRNHCQAQFTIPLLGNHDHAAVEVFCYSTATLKDAITEQLQEYADTWRDVAPLKDAELAELIRKDRIDVLIDLTMHMDRNKLFVFAERAAPVQACWLAYPGTTGLAEMDYRIGDPHLDPPGKDAMSTEKTIRLPHSFWCYDPLTREPAVNELPALSNGYITFGCMNNFVKFNEQTLDAWTEVMRALPDSRLILLTLPGKARQRVRDSFQRMGIDASRVELIDRQTRMNYLRLHHRFDLCLDTFPYNGHTTTLDAVWMGVPPLTAPGETTVSRGGLSILSNVGLADWVARDIQSLPQKAVEIASDLPKLAEIRRGLRRRMEQSPLMNARQFARDMEAAYRQMWRTSCATSAG